MRSVRLPLITTVAALVMLGVSFSNAAESNFDSFGGNMSLQGEATGFFHLEEIDGRHFLITPEGHGYRALGINHFHMMTSKDHGGAIAQIREWGFNAGCYQGPKWIWNRYPYTKGINLVPTSPYRPDSEFGFRDVFDPAFLATLEESIRTVVEPQAENRFLIGYFWTDIGVWEKDRKGESWIGFYKSLPADAPGGKVWREWKEKHPAADENDFLAVIASQLFSNAHAMIRKYDMNHLIFGDRWHEIDMPDHVVRESLPYVDAMAIQPTSKEFNHAFFERVYETFGKPIYIADHVSSFATEEHPVTMGQKAKSPEEYVGYYERYVTTAMSQPYLVGFNKCQYQDQVSSDGMLKQGLLRRDGKPYSTVDGIGAANRKALEFAYASTSGKQASEGKGGTAFAVSLAEVQDGTFEVSPPLPEDGMVAAGTKLMLKATAAPGFALDSVFAEVTGFKKWTVYLESMTSPWEVTVDQDMRLGASFVEESALAGFRVIHDVVYAQPGVKPLKYDVYSPNGAEGLPCIVIIHGGGWSANDENIMRGLARELVRGGGYVVCSIDYRWLKNRDGDKEPNTMPDLIEDVFGAIAHIQEHATEYGADATRIAVTGDSAGGHLSAAVANMAGMIGEGGFGEKDRVFEYRPSYVPEGKSIVQVGDEISRAIRAAVPSYGVFGGAMMEKHAEDLPEGGAAAISPIDTIPNPKDRVVHTLLLRGTRDWIKDEDFQAYADALKAAGQPVEYVQIEGVGHAFLDWKPNAKTRATFEKFAVPTAAKMKAFFDLVFHR